ncbi:LysR family transcriptional regulator [Variovorax sp. J31P179]|uniref:LysR family transcriptional regulator n=1 Tax=Variovorax sp. J31P179 TaxID=3053508 RepID=UPI002578479D|nr:LysR family transcriptional regulator [Variovorax sp. J31P179]MDM0085365.1 LysR family transcriptional regulator [Variovorax sp. J31P179]
MIKTHLLRYFIVLAEEMHFGRAAARLSISQPPLSSAIKALEEELQVRLIERDSKRFFLTPAGASFLSDAREILERVHKAKLSTQAVASGSKGSLDIGFTASSIYRLIPEIVRSFSQFAPQIEVTLKEVSSTDQLHQLLAGQLDLGVVNVPTVRLDLDYLPLIKDQMIICLPADHPQAGQSEVELPLLREETFIMPARDVSPTHYDNVVSIFNGCEIHPRVRHATRQWMSTIALVSKGMGVAIMPSSLRQSGLAGTKFLPIKGVDVDAPAGFVWNKQVRKPAVTMFVAHAKLMLSPIQTN